MELCCTCWSVTSRYNQLQKTTVDRLNSTCTVERGHYDDCRRVIEKNRIKKPSGIAWYQITSIVHVVIGALINTKRRDCVCYNNYTRVPSIITIATDDNFVGFEALIENSPTTIYHCKHLHYYYVMLCSPGETQTTRKRQIVNLVIDCSRYCCSYYNIMSVDIKIVRRRLRFDLITLSSIPCNNYQYTCATIVLPRFTGFSVSPRVNLRCISRFTFKIGRGNRDNLI